LVFQDRVSLYSPGCPGTHFVDQAGLELRNLPASASQMLGSKVCATTPGTQLFLQGSLVVQADLNLAITKDSLKLLILLPLSQVHMLCKCSSYAAPQFTSSPSTITDLVWNVDVFHRTGKQELCNFLFFQRELPSELWGIFDKEEVDVKVEDKKNEVCMSTKPVFQPFSGQGHRLGR
jgi:hypothetical protein